MARFDSHLWRKFFALAIPYWRYDQKWRARGLLLLLVVLMLAETYFNVKFNEQTGEFTSALAAQESERFWRSIRLSVVVLAVAVPVHAFYYFVRDQLGINWRRWMTHRFLNNYFRNRAYYDLNSNDTIDNPDQRISEDINAFTTRSLYFLLIFAGSIIELVAFSGVLWSISKWLVIFLFVYAVAGTFITAFVFGKPLVGLNFFQLRREADFRFSLVRIRENAESIALYQGEEEELSHVKKRFSEVYGNYRRLIRRQLYLDLFQYAYSSAPIILPSVILAREVISGDMEVGRVVQAAGAFTSILKSLTIIMEKFQILSTFAAGIERLDTFSKALASGASGRAKAEQVIETVEGPRLAMEDITVQTPDARRTLVKDLDVEVGEGKGLMIVGPSGGGKSSVLRVLAGLWNAGAGKVVRPPLKELLFLSQQPYMVLGTLRDQILYPHDGSKVSDDELLELLKTVNLPDLAERVGGLDAELDWGKVLSVGEQQRLVFARALHSNPRFAMLDEATSALDPKNEERLYAKLKATATTFVSVSHHPAILKFHDQVLEVSGDGDWELHPAKGYDFTQ